MKRLLIGPAGCGKTHQILSEFETFLKSDTDPLRERAFFLVPSAEHTGRIITRLLTGGIPGFFHRRVTTLSRLISGFFGIGEEGIATNMTRYALIREIIEKENWEIFGEIQKSPGFLNHMIGFIGELKEACVSAPFFREQMNLLKRLEPDLAPKYEALASLYEAYEGSLALKGLRDRQDGFQIFQERKQKGAYHHCRLENLWLDGFFDFSELQLAYLQELCDMSEQVTITLTYENSKKRDLFEPLGETFKTLQKMGFEIEEVKGKHTRFASREIAVIEKNLFTEDPPSPCPLPKGEDKGEGKAPLDGNVMIFEAIGVEGEIEMIARQIERLYKSGQYRFSDFAVLFREIGIYESVIRSVFERYDIPVELHEREKLGFSPMIRVIGGLLKLFRDGWKRGDVMEFLKSSYVQALAGEKSYEWISELENRSLEKGVFRGRDAWLGVWSKKPEDAGFEEQKRERMHVLGEAEDALRSAADFSAFKKILLNTVLKTFRIFSKVSTIEEHVRRDAISYRRLEAILDEIEYSFARTGGLTFDLFTDRFFRLVDLDLYSIHERDRNRVQIYSVSLARQKEYKVVFVAGLLEKKFPVQLKEDPVFSDWERRLFNADRARQLLPEKMPRQRMERYLFYLAATRASEKLIFSYPRLDLEGKESLPSYYIEEVDALFEGGVPMKKQDLGRPYPHLEEAVNDRELEMGVMGELWAPDFQERENRPLVMALTRALMSKPSSRAKFERAFFEVENQLTDPEINKLNVFKPYETSPTTLEEYSRCAFKYYAHRVLKLYDPEEDVNVMRRGLIIHRVLQNCFEKWKAQGYPPLEKALKQAMAEMDEASQDFPLILEQSYQYDLEREAAAEMITGFLKHELERLAASPLKPEYFELDFGRTPGGVPALEIPGEKQPIIIRGQIDRIDLDAEKKVGAVLDYKRTAGAAKYDRKDFEMGVSLQLPIYSMVLERLLKKKVAGAELYAVRERKKNGFYQTDYKSYFPGLSPRKTTLSEAEFQALLAKSESWIRVFSQSMANQEIPVRPRTETECSWCSYASVCRIQKWRIPLIVEDARAEVFGKKEYAQ